MSDVYLLWHENSSSGDQKLLGVFLTREEAETVTESYLELQGFSGKRDGFTIDKYIVGNRYWSEGYQD